MVFTSPMVQIENMKYIGPIKNKGQHWFKESMEWSEDKPDMNFIADSKNKEAKRNKSSKGPKAL
jgi:hypothetical protein